MFTEGEKVLLIISPIKGVVLVFKKCKLCPRYILLIEILRESGWKHVDWHEPYYFWGSPGIQSFYDKSVSQV